MLFLFEVPKEEKQLPHQGLDFIVETSFLVEMKIENRGKIYFPWKKIDKQTFFPKKIKVMEL